MGSGLVETENQSKPIYRQRMCTDCCGVVTALLTMNVAAKFQSYICLAEACHSSLCVATNRSMIDPKRKLYKPKHWRIKTSDIHF